MVNDFELLDHPSDIGILGRGQSREEALAALSRGLSSVMTDVELIRPTMEREFHVGGSDLAEQVVNWLNEILFFFDTEALLFSEFVVENWTPGGLTGRARGERLDGDRHTLRTAVKAATYHQFEMRQNGRTWELRVFVDV